MFINEQAKVAVKIADLAKWSFDKPWSTQVFVPLKHSTNKK